MESLLIDWGLPALLVVSFLAATVLPVASEWLLAALVIKAVDPGVAVGTATLGNTLGAMTTWALGIWGGPYVLRRWLKISTRDRKRAECWYARWGSWSLLLAWPPSWAIPCALWADLLRVPLWRFTLLVAAGKAARYAAIAWMTQNLIS